MDTLVLPEALPSDLAHQSISGWFNTYADDNVPGIRMDTIRAVKVSVYLNRLRFYR